MRPKIPTLVQALTGREGSDEPASLAGFVAVQRAEFGPPDSRRSQARREDRISDEDTGSLFKRRRQDRAPSKITQLRCRAARLGTYVLPHEPT
jgi:hypothetical protein